MVTVGELMTRFGSDKNKEHSYGPVYDELFALRRDSVRSLLEIGVLHGASLYGWREYFPNAQIIGLDHWASPVLDTRIQTVRADSRKSDEISDAFKLANINSSFDIIIDDGGHWLEEQRDTWENCKSYLAPGGIYVIEDLQSVGAMEWFREIGFEIRDLRPQKGRGDDILAIHRG